MTRHGGRSGDRHGGQNRPKIEPKTDQNHSQNKLLNEVDLQTIFSSKKEPFVKVFEVTFDQKMMDLQAKVEAYMVNVNL